MRRSCAILLVLVMLTALLASCTDGGTPAGGTPGATATPQPTPISYTGADFSGKWAVSALYDSTGKALTTDEIAQAGANFTLELLDSGCYFVYDAQGAPIGQGTYSVSQQELTFSANGAQTVYAIESIDTLRCKAEDGSVTVMTRLPAETEEELTEPEQEDTAETDMDEPEEEDAEAPDTSPTDSQQTDPEA